MSLMHLLIFLNRAEKVVDATGLLHRQTLLLGQLALHTSDCLLLVLVQFLELLHLETHFTELELIRLSDPLDLGLMLLLHHLNLHSMALDKLFDLLSVPLMDLRRNLVPDELVHLLNLLKDSSLQRQFIIAVMVLTPIGRYTRLQLLNDLQFLLQDFLQVSDLNLQNCSLLASTFDQFSLHALHFNFFGHKKILVGQNIGFQVLHLLFVKLVELLLD